MSQIDPTLVDSVAAVQSRIADAARRSGREAGAVRLIAVTKYVGVEFIRQLLAIGLRDFGESRVQQLSPRAAELGAALQQWSDPRSISPTWHLIGNLQRNKVRAALEATRIIHSLDSLRLAEAVSRIAAELGCTVDVMIEVNVSGEESKNGVPFAESDALAEAVSGLRAISLRGLMTMAPAADAGDSARRHFARLRELRDRWQKTGIAPRSCTELSMGMSGDFEAAIQEGSTCVRLGSVLFDGVRTK